jgi:hypothetical protein
MNLICVTESELAQWISRKYLDTLATRVFSDLEVLTPNVFYGGPYLKQEDARGRIIVSVKDTWKKLSLFQDNCQSAEVVSIPVSEIIEIAPSMDQHANKLAATYRLPIARWSAEQEWDKWLFNQATLEISRAIFTETSRAGCIGKEILTNKDTLDKIIRKSLRPDSTTNQENSINGWGLVLEKRHTWVQSLRVKGHLEHTSMFLASLVQVSSEISYRSTTFNFDLQSADRGWIFEDMSDEIIQELDKFDLENNLKIPPIFCVVAYLRLYDEIQNGNKDWRVIFNLIRFTKYSVSSLHADIMMVSLLSSLKAEEIYSTGIPEIYMM